MAIKDYFKLQLRKPVLSEEEKTKVKEAEHIQKFLENAYSRLESIEILNANGKSTDAILISNSLLGDLRKFGYEFSEKKTYSNSISNAQFLAGLSNSEVKTIFANFTDLIQNDSIPENTNEEELEKIEGSLADLLSSLEKHFKKHVKKELLTALDLFKSRLKVQSGLVVALALCIVFSFVNYRTNNPDLLQTKFQVFFLEEKDGIPLQKLSFVNDVDISKKGQWVTYEFPISSIRQLSGIRMDPADNRKVRLSIENFQILGDKDQILFERRIDYDQAGLPRLQESFGPMNDLKLAGKSKPNQLIELETIGEDPYLTVFFDSIKSPKKVLVKVRHIEAHKKFKD